MAAIMFGFRMAFVQLSNGGSKTEQTIQNQNKMAAILFGFQATILKRNETIWKQNKTISKGNKMANILFLNHPNTELEKVRYWDGVPFEVFGIWAPTVPD